MVEGNSRSKPPLPFEHPPNLKRYSELMGVRVSLGGFWGGGKGEGAEKIVKCFRFEGFWFYAGYGFMGGEGLVVFLLMLGRGLKIATFFLVTILFRKISFSVNLCFLHKEHTLLSLLFITYYIFHKSY